LADKIVALARYQKLMNYQEYDGRVNVGKLNVDHNPQVSMNYGITSIPAILFIKGGKVVDKLVGAQPKSNFVKKIEQHI
jgi:thioredoxin 1